MPVEPLPIYVTTRDKALLDMLHQCSAFTQLAIQHHDASELQPSTPGVWLHDFDEDSSISLPAFCHQIGKQPHLVGLVVSANALNDTIAYALNHGIDAFLSKPLIIDTLRDTLSKLALRLARRLHRQRLAEILGPQMAKLTLREQSILDGLRQGRGIKELAYSLELSEKTVSMYRRNLMRMFNAQNSTQLVLYASWWHLYCQGQLA